MTAAIALAAPPTSLAAPAEACACSAYGNHPDPAAAQRGGGFLAVVTQTNDKGNGLVLRVDRSAAPTGDNYKPFKEPPPPLQTTLTGKAAASGCGYVPFQGVKANRQQRRGFPPDAADADRPGRHAPASGQPLADRRHERDVAA